MPNATYLTYPEMTELVRVGADRGQVERSVVSWTYVQLCRQVLSDVDKESTMEFTIRSLALGPDLGANSLAVALLHLARENFKEKSGLNGPILALASDEYVAFGMWVTRNNIKLPQPVTAASLATVTKQWIGEIGPHCPRSLWQSYALRQPAYAGLRKDLLEWRQRG
jgi:hypothetical protein